MNFIWSISSLSCYEGKKRIKIVHKQFNALIVNPFYPWKSQKTRGFLTFSRGIEMKHWVKIGYYKKTLILGLGPMSDDSTSQISIHDRKSWTMFSKSSIIDV